MEQIKNYYYDLEPNERINLFKEIYSLIENDSDIIEDEDSLDNYTEMTISLQNAIIQINSIKEKNLELLEENLSIKERLKELELRDLNFDREIEDLKSNYEEKIKQLTERFREEKSQLIREQITQPLSMKYVEDKLKISTEVNNFVKLKIEEFRNYLDNLSKIDLIKVYEDLKNDPDIKIRVLSANILNFIHSGNKKITQSIEKKIMLEIERAMIEEDKEVLDNDYR